MLHLVPPVATRRVLLHACCAPCSAAVVECLVANDLRPTLFYYNPNIYPLAEYERRCDEAQRFASAQGIPFVAGVWDHERWREAVRGVEDAAERGARCERCFLLRLRAAARYARSAGYPLFATTLASSRWKDLTQVNRAGCAAAEEEGAVVFWQQNWRKGGLQERRAVLLREYKFYNQQYCGCEFSMRRAAARAEEVCP